MPEGDPILKYTHYQSYRHLKSGQGQRVTSQGSKKCIGSQKSKITSQPAGDIGDLGSD